MTVREHFQRAQGHLSLVLAVVAAVLIGFLLYFNPHAPRYQYLLWGLGMGAVVFVIAFPITNTIFRCPSCGTTHSAMRRAESGRFNDLRPVWDRWDKCPNCGLSFDAEWPGS